MLPPTPSRLAVLGENAQAIVNSRRNGIRGNTMTHSKLIAGLMGPLLLALGGAMIINRAMFATMASELAANPGMIFLTGILSLIAGVAVVRIHNRWDGDWRVIVTVLGWLAVIGGIVRMWFPQMAAPIVEGLGLSQSTVVLAGLAVTALGAFLSYKGYSADI